MKKKVFSIPIYKGKLIVCITDDITSTAKQFGIEDERGNKFVATTYFNVKYNNKHTTVMIFNNKHGISYNTICHEIYHVTSGILLRAGVDASYDNDEAGAYLTGWIGEVVFKTLVKDFGIEIAFKD